MKLPQGRSDDTRDGSTLEVNECLGQGHLLRTAWAVASDPLSHLLVAEDPQPDRRRKLLKRYGQKLITHRVIVAGQSRTGATTRTAFRSVPAVPWFTRQFVAWSCGPSALGNSRRKTGVGDATSASVQLASPAGSASVRPRSYVRNVTGVSWCLPSQPGTRGMPAASLRAADTVGYLWRVTVTTREVAASVRFNFNPDNIWPVTNNPEVDRVLAALVDLCEPLHDCFCWADLRRCDALPELRELSVYAWHGTHTVRALAHHKLGVADLGKWRLSGNHARNGELWLTDGQYQARVLHALSDKQVPPPGGNTARRAYYRNLPLTLFDLPLYGPVNDRVLLLWRIDPKSHNAAFRVVRPIGNWKWGERAQTDLDFILPRSAVDWGDLEWLPSDEGLELEIPAEEGGAEDVGGLSG